MSGIKGVIVRGKTCYELHLGIFRDIGRFTSFTDPTCKINTPKRSVRIFMVRFRNNPATIAGSIRVGDPLIGNFFVIWVFPIEVTATLIDIKHHLYAYVVRIV